MFLYGVEITLRIINKYYLKLKRQISSRYKLDRSTLTSLKTSQSTKMDVNPKYTKLVNYFILLYTAWKYITTLILHFAYFANRANNKITFVYRVKTTRSS